MNIVSRSDAAQADRHDPATLRSAVPAASTALRTATPCSEMPQPVQPDTAALPQHVRIRQQPSLKSWSECALEPSRAARGSASPHQSAGANMHCNVGLAILEKVGPISASLLGGTHCVSIVGTPFSLIPRSSASRRSASSTMTTAWSCTHEHTASGCAHRPTMCGAHWRTKSLRRSGNGAVGRASAADAPRPTRTATVARL